MPYDVAKLIDRLDNHIIPNIVPDVSRPLLGKPASFASVLTASALLRIQVLASTAQGSPEDRFKRLRTLERLTAKALEVSFIQHKYNREVGHANP
jgi:hypothetical protein